LTKTLDYKLKLKPIYLSTTNWPSVY